MASTGAEAQSSAGERPATSWDRTGLIFFGISVLVLIGSWALLFWKMPYTSEPVLLHYTIYFGVDLIGSWYQLLWLPGTGVALLLINTLLVLRGGFDRLINRLLLASTAFFQVVVLVGIFLLVLLNG